MFDLERRLSLGSTTSIVAAESQQLSAQQRQRDVFESHRHRVFAVGYYMTANEIEAEQILTDTFLHAFENQKEPDAGGIDRALLRELESRFSLQPCEPAIADRSLLLARVAARRTDMEEALGVLPPAERLIFLLKDVEGYPVSRIAELLETSERDIQRQLFSARIRLRNEMAAAQCQKSRGPLGAQQELDQVEPAPA